MALTLTGGEDGGVTEGRRGASARMRNMSNVDFNEEVKMFLRVDRWQSKENKKERQSK